MKILRVTLLIGVIAALAATSAVAATPAAKTPGPPVARAAGGDIVVVMYPAIVNVRLVRTQKLLDSAAEYQDLGDTEKAAQALTGARSNLRKAWAAAKYVIENVPAPPPAEDLRMIPSIRARMSGDPVVGVSPYADMYATTAAVLALQHAVATTAIGMIDQASEPLLTAVNKTLFAALNDRDAAIAYVHSLPAPPPVEDLRARTSGAEPVAGDWSTTMQNILFDIDDELLQVEGVRALVKLSPGRGRMLDLVELQSTKASRNINRFWPPVPVDD